MLTVFGYMARPDLVLQDNMMCLQNRQPQEFEHQKYVQIRQKTVQILSFVLNGISYISYIFYHYNFERQKYHFFSYA